MKKLLSAILIAALLIPALAAAERPTFTGTSYVVFNDGIMSFDNVFLTDNEFVQYSPRDELGRVGPAMAYLGPKRFQASRDSIANYTPTGFINAYYDFISGGSLYHRCHLIAHRMTSSGEYAENLFTGTAYLNLGIMSKIEGEIAEYISRTQNHVLYKVTPDFVDDELVCRGVIIEATSIEDQEIRYCYYCFNVQPGVVIDYRTGENRLAQYAETMPEEDSGLSLISDADPEPATVTRSIPEPTAADSSTPQPTQEPNIRLYVLNNGTHRFHYPDCKSVHDIKPENYQEFTGTREEIIKMGYKSCGNCHP